MIIRTLSTRRLKARRGDTGADDQHPRVPKVGSADGDNNSNSGYSSESRSRGDIAHRRSAMRNRDSIEPGEEGTGRENRLQVARRTSLDQQELVVHKSPRRRKPTPQRRRLALQRASSNPIWCKVM
jgi:hypothetical protein